MLLVVAVQGEEHHHHDDGDDGQDEDVLGLHGGPFGCRLRTRRIGPRAPRRNRPYGAGALALPRFRRPRV